MRLDASIGWVKPLIWRETGWGVSDWVDGKSMEVMGWERM